MGHGRQWRWEESKFKDSLQTGSELVRMMGPVVSWWGSDPVRLAAGAVTLGGRWFSHLELKTDLWGLSPSTHRAKGTMVTSTKRE